MIYHRMLCEQARLEKEIQSLNHQIENLPSGNLFFSHNGKYVKWYQCNNGHQTYIKKNNHHLAEQLAKKKYLTAKREELIQELKAVNLYLKHHHSKDSSAEQMLLPNSDYYEFLKSDYLPLSEELNAWMNAPYEQNKMHPEHLLQPTISGHIVRSKSEALIDTILCKNQIPFRYEAALKLKHTTYYPDFTIRHPHTGKTYYWEHFGLMDNPDYSKKAILKLQQYSEHGIIPGIQLLTTFETQETPLSPEWVETIVQYHFT